MNKGQSNIVPPKKGEIRNPNGKPKGTLNRATVWKKFLKIVEVMESPFTEQEEEFTQLEIIALAQLKKARDGDTLAYKTIMDERFGLATQKQDVTSGGEKIETIRVFELPSNGR